MFTIAGITYIKLFLDDLEAVGPLGDAERGRLFTALLQYAKTGEAPRLSGNERFLFPIMRARLDRDMAEYRSFCEKQADNGRKGGRPRKVPGPDDPKNPPLFPETQKSQDKDKEKDKEKEKEKEKDEDIASGPGGPGAVDLEAYRQVFLEECPGLPKPVPASKWSQARKDAVRSLDATLEEFRDACRRVKRSSFLMGIATGFQGCSLDWILKPQNWQKIVEGNYDDRALPGQRKASYDIDQLEAMAVFDLPENL